MTEDGAPKVSDESVAAASAARQRKKRKWDQPAESLVAAGLAVPGALPFLGGIPGIALPGVASLSGPILTSPVPATFATASQLASIPQNATVIVQKLNQPKIQDELIAREIVINDAEPTIRYKLTKRQTQEEIQKSTGAVVITRGKYHPPNGPSDTEKPLYLHISAGSHCKDTAERIKAVDRAASMVEEILKQGQNPLSASTSLNSALGNGGVAPPLSACLFLGFDPDPSLNIATRIRGPNDQYINHIMNETGATVVLRGRGSGNVENSQAEETQQPLHLCLTSTTPKSLEDARILAENLLDTICAECGTSRISSCKVYNAVPPPQQLLAGVVASAVPGSACTATTSVPATPLFAPNAVPVSSGPNIHPPGSSQPGGLFSYGSPQPNMVGYSLPTVSGGTSYSGYGGIYPQATPLQQVALALRQAPASSTTSTASTLQTSTLPKTGPKTGPSVETEKRTPQKRKFQELPATSKGLTTLHQNSQQESEFLKPGSEDSGARNVSSMPPPKKFIPPCSNGMPPPPPRSMPPPSPKFSLPSSPLEAESRKSVTENMPPPPPKFSSPRSPPKFENGHVVMPPPPPKFWTSQLRSKSQNGSSFEKPSSGPVSDTLLKLVEYGEEDEDIDGVDGESLGDNSTWNATSKPFWAV